MGQSTKNRPTAGAPRRQVAVAGDWHGDDNWARHALHLADQGGIDVVLHAGDFGVWPGLRGQEFLDVVDWVCGDLDQVLLVTPGNHEDYDQIELTPVEDRGDGFGPVAWIRDRVGLLPRGHRFTLTGVSGQQRSVVSLGGGPSLDFARRMPGVSWWPQEAITAADVRRVADGGVADVMVAHDAPGAPYQVPSVQRICASNDFGWSDRALAYATEQRDLMTHAFEAAAPRVFFHGHYHAAGRARVEVDGRSCEVVCLPAQGCAGNLVALDLETLTVTSLTTPPGL